MWYSTNMKIPTNLKVLDTRYGSIFSPRLGLSQKPVRDLMGFIAWNGKISPAELTPSEQKLLRCGVEHGDLHMRDGFFRWPDN